MDIDETAKLMEAIKVRSDDAPDIFVVTYTIEEHIRQQAEIEMQVIMPVSDVAYRKPFTDIRGIPFESFGTSKECMDRAEELAIAGKKPKVMLHETLPKELASHPFAVREMAKWAEQQKQEMMTPKMPHIEFGRSKPLGQDGVNFRRSW